MNFFERIRQVQISAMLITSNRDLSPEKKVALLYDEIQSLPVNPIKTQNRKERSNNAKK